MPSARAGTAENAAKMKRGGRAIPRRSNCARSPALLRLLSPPFPPASIVSPPSARRGSRSRPRSRCCPRHRQSATSFSAAFRMTAPGCMRSRWRNLAALVPTEPAAALRGTNFREGAMNSDHALRALFCGALLTIAAASSASAEGTFDIPAGAHFNLQKLDRVGDYLRDQIANGKIPGAILLIQQHGKPVYHEFFGVQDVVSKAPMIDNTIFRSYSMTKPITSVAAMMLITEVRLKLDDPLAKYIPSFAKAKVGVEKKAENGEKVL